MMDDLTAFESGRPNLDRTDPTWLCNRDAFDGPPPNILMMGGHRVRWRRNHKIRFPEDLFRLPLISGWEHPRRRHVFRVSQRSTLIHPASDRLDLGITEGHV